MKNIGKTSALMAALASLALGSSAQAALTAGLVAYYPFDGNATDASGYGNDLTATGSGATIGTTNVLVGTGYADTNGTDYFKTAENTQNDLSGSNSIQAWVRYTGDQRGGIVSKSLGWLQNGTGNKFPYHLEAWNGSANTLNDGWTDISGGSSLNDGNWHHIVTVWSDTNDGGTGTIHLYVDGSLVRSSVWTSESGGNATGTISDEAGNGAPLAIGGSDQSLNRYFNGSIDEVALWNRELTTTEIAELYNNGAGTPVPEPSSLGFLAGTFGLALVVRRRK